MFRRAIYSLRARDSPPLLHILAYIFLFMFRPDLPYFIFLFFCIFFPSVFQLLHLPLPVTTSIHPHCIKFVLWFLYACFLLTYLFHSKFSLSFYFLLFHLSFLHAYASLLLSCFEFSFSGSQTGFSTGFFPLHLWHFSCFCCILFFS